MPVVNKQAVAQTFGRAARHYQQHDGLQRHSGEYLLALARHQSPARLLDAGCGPGRFSHHFSLHGWQVTALDLSPAMLQQAERQQSATRYVPGDIEALPFDDASFDLCWSNLVLQWCGDVRCALEELLRVTAPGGQLLFSTLGAGSLPEIHQAWRVLDEVVPVNRFLTLEELQCRLAGLALRWQRQIITLHFPAVLAALQSLKGIGATHLHHSSDRPALTRQRLARLAQSWPRDAQGYTLSYELIFGVADGS